MPGKADSVRFYQAVALLLAVNVVLFLLRGVLAPADPAPDAGATATQFAPTTTMTPRATATGLPGIAPTSRKVTATPTMTLPSPPSPTTTPTASASPPAPRGPTEHTVAAGETLGSIAERYDVTVEALIEANNIENPNLIVEGTRLLIPAPEAPPP